jgi:hypothetical protein
MRVALLAVAALLVTAAPAAADVPPGFDLFETDPGQTVFSFREEFTIPPNFFDEGSAPFQGDVTFAGVPLGTFQGRNVGDADTIVRRLGTVTLAPPFPASGTTAVELVALNLASIEPIQVDVGGTPQLWDVRMGLSPTNPTTGNIDITQTEQGGGTFASQLRIFPGFTFTRLSDGATRELDTALGSGEQRAIKSFKLTQVAQNVPWRAGCVPPALRLPGLQGPFCPGLTINPSRAPYAQASRIFPHRVFAAQPALEHFRCYPATPRRAFRQRRVRLSDQFATGMVTVGAPNTLCAPARKNREPFRNEKAHLLCFGITPKSRGGKPQVSVRNQFGTEQLTLTAARSLCLPSVKGRIRANLRRLAARDRIDHFACYGVRGDEQEVRATFDDQFSRKEERVLEATRICAPAQKNSARILDPVQHLVCYSIREAQSNRRNGVWKLLNQFGKQVVGVGRQNSVCVPSAKTRSSG